MLRIAIGLLAGFFVHCSLAAQIEGVRLWRSPDSTRIVFDLDSPVEHKIFPLQSPARVVVDIENADLTHAVEQLPLGDTPIAQVRFGTRNKTGLRVVFDLRSQVRPRSFFLPSHGDKPDRLVVDLFDKGPAVSQQVQAISDVIPDKRDIVIAVDAGHGGEDPGALGPRNIREKDVVLAISQQLVWMINAEPGYKAHLVRRGDYYVPLRSRRDKARELRADLFVSIHADAFKNPKANGASVYALSNSGATSETARFLAAKENEADLIGGVGSVSLTEVDKVLAGVLVDLSMTATLSNSLDVGSRVLREMGKITKLHKQQVEQAGFAVLKSPDVPSILVETGFISNPQEANKLNNRAYRKQMATSIFNGIRHYFDTTPPAGSYIAWRKANPGNDQEYVISSGDTLSGIAERHNVSLKQLLDHNDLTASAVIRVGQKLAIPAG